MSAVSCLKKIISDAKPRNNHNSSGSSNNNNNSCPVVNINFGMQVHPAEKSLIGRNASSGSHC